MTKKHIKEWQELQRKRVFDKYRLIDRVDFRLPNNIELDFYIRSEGSTATVFALTDQGEVILARQFRPGPKKILDELPGGYVDPGELPLQAAKREFLEETGYTGNFIQICESVDDAYSHAQKYCFIATSCRKVADPVQTDSEHTVVILKSVAEFRDQLRTGQLSDLGAGYLALDYLDRL